MAGGPFRYLGDSVIKDIAAKTSPEFARWLINMVGWSSGVLTDAEKAAVPTTAQKAALAGTYGTPSGVNKYVTNDDPRVSQNLFSGRFTMAAANNMIINNPHVTASSVIILQDENSDATVLQKGDSRLYIDPVDHVVGVSFVVRTGDAGAAAGTEKFGYIIAN